MHRNLLLPLNFLYKLFLPSKIYHLSVSTADLPDHPESVARTAHWVMKSDQHNCPDNDSDSIALSGGQCSLDVQNSNSKADSGTCNSSVRTEQGSDVAHC